MIHNNPVATTQAYRHRQVTLKIAPATEIMLGVSRVIYKKYV